MKIALYKNIEHGYESVVIIDSSDIEEYYERSTDCVRISEFVEIDFPMIEVDINAKKVEAIDRQIQKAKAGIEMLEQTKAELLCLTDMRA